MESERWQQIKNLFFSASEIEMSERDEFLKRACKGDAELFQEVQSLLVAHEQPGSFVGDSAFELGMQVLKDEQTNLQRSTLGHYKIIKLIGSGGMGEVFLAEDPRLGRRVAIKLLPRSFLEDPSRIFRFQQEARAASSISHPNIAHIYEIGVDAGCHFTSMEFIDGITLRRLMDQRRLELQEAVNIALQVGSALVAAHTSRIIHRDIKPENIMIHRDGHIKVLDFGLAKLTDRISEHWDAATIIDAVETQPGMVMGSPAYMSPEQARGLEVDARTDIWSLGIVLYEMVTGWTPFHGSTNMDVLAGVLKEKPTPLIEHIDNAPPGLEKILKKMLSKDKDERYLSSSDMITDLQNLARNLRSNGFSELLEIDEEEIPFLSRQEREARIRHMLTIVDKYGELPDETISLVEDESYLALFEENLGLSVHRRVLTNSLSALRSLAGEWDGRRICRHSSIPLLLSLYDDANRENDMKIKQHVIEVLAAIDSVSTYDFLLARLQEGKPEIVEAILSQWQFMDEFWEGRSWIPRIIPVLYSLIAMPQNKCLYFNSGGRESDFRFWVFRCLQKLGRRDSRQHIETFLSTVTWPTEALVEAAMAHWYVTGSTAYIPILRRAAKSRGGYNAKRFLKIIKENEKKGSKTR